MKISLRTAHQDELNGLTDYQRKVFWTLHTREDAINMSARTVACLVYGGNMNISYRKIMAVEKVLKILLDKRLVFRGNVATWFRVPVEGKVR